MPNSVFLEVDGKLYQGFKEINYYKNIEDLSGSFSFIATTQDKNFTPFKGQEVCKIIIDDVPVITGYIESITYSYDNSSHIISVNGRDKTSDVIDNSVIGNIDFKAPIKLETIIENVLKEANLDINVINEAGALKAFEDFGANESMSAKVGENMFEFLEKFCRKRAVLLTSNGDGDIVIARAGQETMNGILLNELENNSNNVKSGSINYDYSNRYYKYICKSQGNASIAGLIDDSTGLGLADLSGTKGQAIDEDIRQTRFLEFTNETSSENSSNEERAKWEANIRRARSLVYTCELNHLFVKTEEIFTSTAFIQSGLNIAGIPEGKKFTFYEPNKLIPVKDDFCGIDAVMLIRSVNYNLSDVGGMRIILELVPKDAYTPQP